MHLTQVKNEKELKSLKNTPRTLHQTTKRCFSSSSLTELMEENTKQLKAAEKSEPFRVAHGMIFDTNLRETIVFLRFNTRLRRDIEPKSYF